MSSSLKDKCSHLDEFFIKLAAELVKTTTSRAAPWKLSFWPTRAQSVTEISSFEMTSPFRWPLQWRHNVHNGVSNHRHFDCLLSRMFRCRSKKTSKLRVTGLCEGNPPVTSGFPSQRASNAENISILWRHRDYLNDIGLTPPGLTCLLCIPRTKYRVLSPRRHTAENLPHTWWVYWRSIWCIITCRSVFEKYEYIFVCYIIILNWNDTGRKGVVTWWHKVPGHQHPW